MAICSTAHQAAKRIVAAAEEGRKIDRTDAITVAIELLAAEALQRTRDRIREWRENDDARQR